LLPSVSGNAVDEAVLQFLDETIRKLGVLAAHTVQYSKGKFMGIPATRSIAIARISGGKIVEEWENVEELGMMQQLGVIPTSG